MQKLLLAADMNSRSPASFLNKMLQLRDKIVTSGIHSCFFTPHPSVPYTTPSPALSTCHCRYFKRTRRAKVNSKTKALSFMVMDEDWSTSGAMVGEAEVTIPAVSLTRTEIKRKISSLLLGTQVIQEHRDPPLLLCNNC